MSILRRSSCKIQILLKLLNRNVGAPMKYYQHTSSGLSSLCCMKHIDEVVHEFKLASRKSSHRTNRGVLGIISECIWFCSHYYLFEVKTDMSAAESARAA